MKGLPDYSFLLSPVYLRSMWIGHTKHALDNQLAGRESHEPTVILFCVNVPVLSEAMVEQLPRVSTASRFFTSTIFFANRFAVRVKATVTVGSNPLGLVLCWVSLFTFRNIGHNNPNHKDNVRYDRQPDTESNAQKDNTKRNSHC